MTDPATRSARLERALARLLGQAPEIEAAAVVSFDGLPMASALPAGMQEDRVAAMSAALLSLGERAAEGLGRGSLNQVYIEGEEGTVFLVAAADEAVVVAVAAREAKVGMMLFEVRRAAAEVVEVLQAPAPVAPPAAVAPAPVHSTPVHGAPVQSAPVPTAPPPVAPAPAPYLAPVPDPLVDPLRAFAVPEPPAWS